MLPIKDAVQYAQNNSWTIASSYFAIIQPVNPKFGEAVGWQYTDNFNKMLHLCLKNVDIPQHTADLVEKILAGEWHFTRNDDEMYAITLTFRDMYGGSLYRIFQNVWSGAKINYPDDYAFNGSVFLIDAKNKNAAAGTSSHLIFNSPKMYITSLSQLQLSHETNEILEFSVEFKTNEPGFDGNVTVSLDGSTVSLKEKLNSGAISGLLQKGINTGMKYVDNFASKTMKSWGTQLGKKVHEWDF